MKINLEIVKSSCIYEKQKITTLNTKELVPKMMFRRRLTEASRIVIYLTKKIGYEKGKILYGSSYGEFPITTGILEDLSNNLRPSPTNFQNSVYNTPVSYLSIQNSYRDEITTISHGKLTSYALLKAASIRAKRDEEILILCCETLFIDGLKLFNEIEFLESGVALKLKLTDKKATHSLNNLKLDNSLPKSIAPLIAISKIENPIIEVEL